VKVPTCRSPLTIDAIYQTVKVTTSSVTYALGRTNNILSITNDSLLLLFICTSHLADTAHRSTSEPCVWATHVLVARRSWLYSRWKSSNSSNNPCSNMASTRKSKRLSRTSWNKHV